MREYLLARISFQSMPVTNTNGFMFGQDGRNLHAVRHCAAKHPPQGMGHKQMVALDSTAFVVATGSRGRE